MFQLDHFEQWVILLQLCNVFRACAAPCVDGLVVVAYGGECATNACQQANQAVLAGVSVLVFIYQQVAQFVLPMLQRVRVLLEQLHRQHDEVVEIDGVVGFDLALVFFV